MPILPFWNSQSLIYNILLFEKYAMNGMTEIEENICLLFLLSVSSLIDDWIWCGLALIAYLGDCDLGD